MTKPVGTAKPPTPNGKLDIATDAGHWLRDENGALTKAFRHICWDGCMFPNQVMMQQQTWNGHSGGDDRGSKDARLA